MFRVYFRFHHTNILQKLGHTQRLNMYRCMCRWPRTVGWCSCRSDPYGRAGHISAQWWPGSWWKRRTPRSRDHSAPRGRALRPARTVPSCSHSEPDPTSQSAWSPASSKFDFNSGIKFCKFKSKCQQTHVSYYLGTMSIGPTAVVEPTVVLLG